MIDKYLPANAVVRAVLILLLSFALYAFLDRFIFDEGIGVGGGVAVGAFLAFFDYRKRTRATGRDRARQDGEAFKG